VEVARLEPDLSTSHLTGGAVFFDARIHSARFVLENIFEAARNGAIVSNYARAERTGPGSVNIQDALSGASFEVSARKLVDATGPWADPYELRLVRGSHIVVPRLNRSDNAIAYFEPSGRIVFVIPWGERLDLSLAGTTDVDHAAGPDDVRITADEVRYLRDILRRLYPRSGEVEPIAAFSSLRPLVRDRASSPTKASRGHRIWNSADGVLHVSGGKYTTYRAMSEQAADEIAKEIAPRIAAVHETERMPVGGNTPERIAELLTEAPRLASEHGVAEVDVALMVGLYGVQTEALLRCLRAEEGAGLTRLERARIVFAVQQEMARRLPDLLFVSTYWGHEARWTEESLASYAGEMGRWLGWDAERTQREIELALRIMAGPEK
jgi:glycerol-3-phosphate dehydrogenase